MLVSLQSDALLLDFGRTKISHYCCKASILYSLRVTQIKYKGFSVYLQLNLIFLLNIIRVLVVKLRQSHTSDIEQVRKAVRAAIVLLPLLGITNALNMINVVDRTPLEFAIWSYTTHFLTSFQGFLISLLYCFLNGEVSKKKMGSTCTYG